VKLGVTGVPRTAELRGALREALETQGHEAPSSADLAADMLQVALRGLGRAVVLESPQLAEQLKRAAKIPDGPLQTLLELARSPRFGQSLSKEELRVFGERFGELAQEQLSELQAEQLDPAGFAELWGPEASVALLDLLYGLAATPRGIRSPQARALDELAEALNLDGMIGASLFAVHDARHAAGALSWRLSGERVTLGSGPGNEIVLPDPQVGRQHCVLQKGPEGWRVTDLGSGRPLLVDGHHVSSAPVGPESQIRVGPWRLTVNEDKLWARAERSFEALSVRGLGRSIGRREILSGVDFTVFAGELIAMVGPSGAGKTTLISALSGVARHDRGEVRLGGRDFHQMLAADPSLVGFVPQDDLIHPELSVEESLHYAGRLRHARALGEAPLKGEVDRVIAELGLSDIRRARIGDALHRGISGGQRKRVNLGQELMSRSTRVLFLDEPTSGLDPRSAQDIVRQVRLLADSGRIVFLVTHDLSPVVMSQVDHLLLMVPGGQVAWFGPPRRACRYFEVETPDLIFDRLEERGPEEWARAWRESAEHTQFVTARGALLGLPSFTASRAGQGGLGGRPDPGAAPRPVPGSIDQLRALTARYARVKLRDRDGLIVLAAQPVMLAAFIYLVFPAATAGAIFMVSLSCLWFGMSLAVRELIADRGIHERERRVGVGLIPYLGAKLGVLGALNVAQCGVFTGIVFVLMGLGGYGFDLAPLIAVQVLTGFVGVCLGLAVSAWLDSSEGAVGSLPLLLIPNICFSSVLVSIRDMSVAAEVLTWVTPARYAFDLSLKMGERLSEAGRVPGRWELRSMTGPLYELGLKPADVTDMGMSPMELVAALLALSATLLAVAVAGATRVRERR
jgi:ABC-type multidrug transport system ATPase subunit